MLGWCACHLKLKINSICRWHKVTLMPTLVSIAAIITENSAFEQTKRHGDLRQEIIYYVPAATCYIQLPKPNIPTFNHFSIAGYQKECYQLWFGALPELNNARTTRAITQLATFKFPLRFWKFATNTPPYPAPPPASHMLLRVGCLGRGVVIQHMRASSSTATCCNFRQPLLQKLITRHLCQQPATLFASPAAIHFPRMWLRFPPPPWLDSPSLSLSSHTSKLLFCLHFRTLKRNEMQP